MRGSTFPYSKQVAALSDCCRRESSLCLCAPVRMSDGLRPAKAVQERCFKSWAIDLAMFSGITFSRACDRQGLELELKIEPYQLVVMVLSAENPKIICVEFKFFSGLLKTTKLRTAVS